MNLNAQPTTTPSPIPPSPTATVFFPTLVPTQTPTPLPTSMPTIARLPSLGEVIFADSFDQDKGWIITEVNYGGVSLVNGRLGLALQQSHTFYSVLSPIASLYDFYAEVDVRADICTDNSEFGLMFRVSLSQEHYRFTVNCSGEAKVLLLRGGAELVLMPLTQTNVALPGILAENRLGVYASGSSYVFYINGSEVFSIQNGALSGGSIGVVLRSRSGEQTTVSFDDFTVWSILPGSTSTSN
ncbi:MAG: hypothetical protein JXA97_01955 [Anaerolineales bacterium]|nr:hypothetical protein [Anaerolineales bacterium]